MSTLEQTEDTNALIKAENVTLGYCLLKHCSATYTANNVSKCISSIKLQDFPILMQEM